MRGTLTVAVVALIATSALLGVAQAATPSGLRWGDCPADVAATGLECSTLEVPLDYRNPAGRKIELAISRLASKNPAQRRGVLLTNPGGPGASGIGFPATMANFDLPQSVRDAYDVIGIDPRGVGHSTPVNCGLTPTQPTGNIPPFARGAADVARQAGVAKRTAEQCAGSPSASLIPHITTANTARDMDRVREVLGERKISYFGSSYGSYLGAVYATLFPQRGDRIVLDSNLGPRGFDQQTGRLLGTGVQDRFPDFAKFAVAHPEYGLGSTPAQVTAKYFELAARLDKTPVGGIDGTLFRQGTFVYLYADSDFPTLAANWRDLGANKPIGSKADLASPEAELDNALSSHLAVVCGDTSWSKSVLNYQIDVAIDRFRYPMFGPAAANIRPCAFWPNEPIEPKVHIGDKGPSNILLSQNLRDPATPLAGARQLRQALGDRARMVTADQGGHGSYLFGTNSCVDAVVTAFLATGKRPHHDLACTAEPASK